MSSNTLISDNNGSITDSNLHIDTQTDIVGGDVSVKIGLTSVKENSRFKIAALIALGTLLAFQLGAASAQQGTSSSYGTEGWGPRVPTISLTPKQRFWNHDHEAQYRAEDGAEWVRLHSQAGAFIGVR